MSLTHSDLHVLFVRLRLHLSLFLFANLLAAVYLDRFLTLLRRFLPCTIAHGGKMKQSHRPIIGGHPTILPFLRQVVNEGFLQYCGPV